MNKTEMFCVFALAAILLLAFYIPLGALTNKRILTISRKRAIAISTYVNSFPALAFAALVICLPMQFAILIIGVAINQYLLVAWHLPDEDGGLLCKWVWGVDIKTTLSLLLLYLGLMLTRSVMHISI